MTMVPTRKFRRLNKFRSITGCLSVSSHGMRNVTLISDTDFPEAPAYPSGQRLHDRRREHVRTDGPGSLRGADPQAAGNGRNGDIDNGHVKNLHERRGGD